MQGIIFRAFGIESAKRKISRIFLTIIPRYYFDNKKKKKHFCRLINYRVSVYKNSLFGNHNGSWNFSSVV